MRRHHLLPAAWEPSRATLPGELYSVLYITVDPAAVAPAVLRSVGTVVAAGDDPGRTLNSLRASGGRGAAAGRGRDLEPGDVLLWRRDAGAAAGAGAG